MSEDIQTVEQEAPTQAEETSEFNSLFNNDEAPPEDATNLNCSHVLQRLQTIIILQISTKTHLKNLYRHVYD